MSLSRVFINSPLHKQFKRFTLISRNHFVPVHEQITENDVELLQKYVDQSHKLMVLTGAGISTESGIPDYRSEGVGLYSKNGYRPMNYQEFVSKHSSRQRYWARSFLSWPFISKLKPNAGHQALNEWQKAGKLFCCVTQNVDRLHQKAGLQSVIELHGNLYVVKCIQCHYQISRSEFQNNLRVLNAQLIETYSIDSLVATIGEDYSRFARPDGDVNVSADFIGNFTIPDCDQCGGIMKPDIVFFGANVVRSLVKHIYHMVDNCDALLVLGSSLQVFSSYRFVDHAFRKGKSIAIVNIGSTRGDRLCTLKRIDAKIGDILPKIRV